mmetsp:Transcript_124367/g.277874  ORF Transcript_124367/g.277874 Transcript_124367/m.277874 type:complete len:231 (+) Transcript_124367:2-694(+)
MALASMSARVRLTRIPTWRSVSCPSTPERQSNPSSCSGLSDPAWQWHQQGGFPHKLLVRWQVPPTLEAGLAKQWDAADAKEEVGHEEGRDATCEFQAFQVGRATEKDTPPHAHLAKVIGMLGETPQAYIDPTVSVRRVRLEATLLHVRCHLHNESQCPECPTDGVTPLELSFRLVVLLRRLRPFGIQDVHGQRRDQDPERLDGPKDNEALRMCLHVVEAAVSAGVQHPEE